MPYETTILSFTIIIVQVSSVPDWLAARTLRPLVTSSLRCPLLPGTNTSIQIKIRYRTWVQFLFNMLWYRVSHPKLFYLSRLKFALR